MAQKTSSLSHAKWMCKYHIVFTPKYRRKIVFNQYRDSLGEISRTLCKYKGVEIIEGHLIPDHVHMLVSIPPRLSVSSFMGYLKGKNALMMSDKHVDLKYKSGSRHFWAEGYYVNTVGPNEQTIARYIREQERHDIVMGKLSVGEYEDPLKSRWTKLLQSWLKRQEQWGLNKVKTSTLRRWSVILGLIARDQTTHFTGGYDWEKELPG